MDSLWKIRAIDGERNTHLNKDNQTNRNYCWIDSLLQLWNWFFYWNRTIFKFISISRMSMIKLFLDTILIFINIAAITATVTALQVFLNMTISIYHV